MKRIVLISMLFIFIPFCAMAMEPNPGCGDVDVDSEVEGESHPIIGGTCDDGIPYNPIVAGGEAAWMLRCSGSNYITIGGWVADTLPDGKSARVKMKCLEGTYYSPKTTGFGDKKSFSRTCTGRTMKVYLQVK